MANPSTYSPPGIPQWEEDVLTVAQEGFQLIVWTDDANSFDWVIETLMEVYAGNNLHTKDFMAKPHIISRKISGKIT